MFAGVVKGFIEFLEKTYTPIYYRNILLTKVYDSGAPVVSKGPPEIVLRIDLRDHKYRRH